MAGERILVAKVGLDGHDRRVTMGRMMRNAEITFVVGGVVPNADVQQLNEADVAAVITPGATADEVAAIIRRTLDEYARA